MIAALHPDEVVTLPRDRLDGFRRQSDEAEAVMAGADAHPLSPVGSSTASRC